MLNIDRITEVNFLFSNLETSKLHFSNSQLNGKKIYNDLVSLSNALSIYNLNVDENIQLLL